MATFSQREGYRPLPDKMVPESITEELRNTIWNFIDSSFTHKEHEKVTSLLWMHLYKLPLDSRPFHWGVTEVSWSDSWKEVRKRILNGKWYEAYDHMEFLTEIHPGLANGFNNILAQEVAAYRLIDKKVCQVTDKGELLELETAMESSDRFSPIAEHVRAALAFMSDRNNPDYRNSIKESISAVEAAVRIVTADPNADFSKALSHLEKIGKIDGALKKGFGAIYGWTSDQNGIRHAMTEKPNLTQVDAKLLLIMCSAFANYLKANDTSS